MPDFTIEHYRVCEQTDRGKWVFNGHVVYYGATPFGPYQFGYTCDCKGFKSRRTCRHVEAAKALRCTWNEEAYAGGTGLEPSPDNTCPECGRETIVIKVAV